MIPGTCRWESWRPRRSRLPAPSDLRPCPSPESGRNIHNPVRAVKPPGWCYVGAPMSYAGDLTQAEFDTLLDRKGGPAAVGHGGGGTWWDVGPWPLFGGTASAAKAGVSLRRNGRSVRAP